MIEISNLVAMTPPNGRLIGAFLLLTLVFIAAEIIYSRLSGHHEHHELNESAASVGVAFGDVVSRVLTSGLVAVPFLWLYQNRLFDIPLDSAWSLLALFLALSFSIIGSIARLIACVGCGRHTLSITRQRISICPLQSGWDGPVN